MKIEYYSEASEVTAQMAAARKDAIAVLPQPYVTAAQMKDSGLRVVLDLTREWNRVCDTQLITGAPWCAPSTQSRTPMSSQLS